MAPKIVVQARLCQGSDVGREAAGSSSVFVQLSTTARFLPSLRDLVPASTLVPGLKAWAIFGSPSGTLPNSEIRPKRQLRPVIDYQTFEGRVVRFGACNRDILVRRSGTSSLLREASEENTSGQILIKRTSRQANSPKGNPV